MKKNTYEKVNFSEIWKLLPHVEFTYQTGVFCRSLIQLKHQAVLLITPYKLFENVVNLFDKKN